MTPPDAQPASLSSHFAELATRPLAVDSPDRVAVQAELVARSGRAFEEARAASQLAAAVATLEAVPEVPRPHLGRWLVLWAFIGALLAIACFTGCGGRETLYGNFWPDLFFQYARVPAWQQATLTTGTPFLASRWTEPEAITELESRQDDPVSYQALVQARIYQKLGLPANYEEHWRKIDPGNGIWPFLKAEALGCALYDERIARNAGENDPAKFLAILAALKEAAACTKWVDSSRRALAIQRAAFRLPHTLAEDSLTGMLLFNARLPEFRGADDAVSVEVHNAKAGLATAAPLAAILDTWTAVSRLRTSQPENPLPVAMPEGMSTLSNDFSYCADIAGLPAQKDQLARLSAVQELHQAEASIVESYRLPGGSFADQWSAGDAFSERRLAEYAANEIDAAILLTGCGLVLLLAVYAIGVWQGGTGLVAGLSPLFPVSGAARVILLGLVLPGAWWWAIVHWTPAGCRGFAINGFYVLGMQRAVWIYHVFSGLLLVAVATVTCARAEAARRVGFLEIGLRHRGERILAGVVIFIAAVLPLLTWEIADHPENAQQILKSISPLLGVPLLWVLWVVVMSVLRASGSVTQRSVVSLCCRPPLVAFCTLLLAGIPWLKHQQSELLSHDAVTTAGPEATRLTNIRIDAQNASIRARLLKFFPK